MYFQFTKNIYFYCCAVFTVVILHTAAGDSSPSSLYPSYMESVSVSGPFQHNNAMAAAGEANGGTGKLELYPLLLSILTTEYYENFNDIFY